MATMDGSDVEPYYILRTPEESLVEVDELHGVATEPTSEAAAEAVRRESEPDTTLPEEENVFFLQPRVTGGPLEADSIIMKQATCEEAKEGVDGLDVEPYYLLHIPEEKIASAEVPELYGEVRGDSRN
ncbi:hypothetical protein MTO96_000350 [Rhipicephalus appendiculatus]